MKHKNDKNTEQNKKHKILEKFLGTIAVSLLSFFVIVPVMKKIVDKYYKDHVYNDYNKPDDDDDDWGPEIVRKEDFKDE